MADSFTGADASFYASMGISAISAVANAFEQSASIRARGDYDSMIADTNAKLASFNAREAIAAGDFEAARKASQGRQEVGAIRAAQGASGIDVRSGSSALTRLAVEDATAMDSLTLRHNAAKRAWGYEMESLEDRFKSKFARLRASADSQQTIINGGLKAISGPLDQELSYMRYSRKLNGAPPVPFPQVK